MLLVFNILLIILIWSQINHHINHTFEGISWDVEDSMYSILMLAGLIVVSLAGIVLILIACVATLILLKTISDDGKMRWGLKFNILPDSFVNSFKKD